MVQSEDDVADEIRKLAILLQKGILNEREFKHVKTALLNNTSEPTNDRRLVMVVILIVLGLMVYSSM